MLVFSASLIACFLAEPTPVMKFGDTPDAARFVPIWGLLAYFVLGAGYKGRIEQLSS